MKKRREKEKNKREEDWELSMVKKVCFFEGDYFFLERERGGDVRENKLGGI